MSLLLWWGFEFGLYGILKYVELRFDLVDGVLDDGYLVSGLLGVVNVLADSVFVDLGWFDVLGYFLKTEFD